MLPYACVDDQSGKEGALGAVRSLVPDDSPLLPNLGRGSANAYILDIQVRIFLSLLFPDVCVAC